MNSEFCAGAVLITFGGVIGKISPLQMLVVTLVESVFYAFNVCLVLDKGYIRIWVDSINNPIGKFFYSASVYR